MLPMLRYLRLVLGACRVSIAVWWHDYVEQAVEGIKGQEKHIKKEV